MKVIKIGLLYNESDPQFILRDLKSLINVKIKYLFDNDNEIIIKFVGDATKEYCDIIIFSFHSLYNTLINEKFNIQALKKSVYNFLNRVKIDKTKNQIFLTQWIEYNNWPYEHNQNLDTFSKLSDYPNLYTLSFNKDSETNLFYPYCVGSFFNISQHIKIDNTNDIFNIKDKFCAYVSSNLNIYKSHIFNLISNNVCPIDHYGKWNNNILKNTNLELLEESSNLILNKYKFILCIENTPSSYNPSYMTEKIERAYINNCVPIYSGCTNITTIFNKKSFINITNLNDNEIIDIINYYNNNDNEYLNMLNEFPFANKNFNYGKYYNDKLKNFIKNIINKL